MLMLFTEIIFYTNNYNFKFRNEITNLETLDIQYQNQSKPSQ